MSIKLKFQQNWNLTKKIKSHQNWNVIKTEMSPKIKIWPNWNITGFVLNNNWIGGMTKEIQIVFENFLFLAGICSTYD